MRSRIQYGKWTPDIPALAVGSQGLVGASNVVPRATGYGPVKSFSVLEHGTLDTRARGAFAVIDQDGVPHNFAGTTAKLFRLSSFKDAEDPGTLADVTRTSGAYSVIDTFRWEFAFFGNTAYAVAPTEDIQYFDLRASTKFADVTPDRTAPRASHVGVVGSHMMVGNTYDITDGRVPNQVWWPAIDNPRSWPTPGTDVATIAQSGRQPLEGEGGWVQAIVSGAEVGAIFQEYRIWRAQYVGGDVMFQFDAVETRRGLLVPDLAIPFGREVLYLAEDGWYIFDYTVSQPVGEESINRTFFADLDSAYLDRISWATDPDAPISYILYPGSGNTSGTPNKVLIFNWATRAFSEASPGNLDLMTRYAAPPASMDADPQDDTTFDVAGTSLDTRQTNFAALTLAGYDQATRKVGTFTGANLVGTLESGDIELSPGGRSLLTSVRPLVHGTKAQIEIAAQDTLDESISYGPKRRPARDGACKDRANGRYHRIRTTLPVGFTDALGAEVEHFPQGVY